MKNTINKAYTVWEGEKFIGTFYSANKREAITTAREIEKRNGKFLRKRQYYSADEVR